MEWLDERFGQYWEALTGLLAERLRPLTLSFFSGVPPSDAGTIANLVGDGKKLRGCLVLAVCDALGGSRERALEAAVLVECVQAASLIHDDLVDDDTLRRNRPATWVEKGGRRAVLLGDLIFATALWRSAEAGQEQVRVLARAIALMAAGAYREPLDVVETRTLLQHRPAGSIAYEQIIQAKTGALFAAAAELGAVAADASPGLREAAAAFGARVGEAYQMADDLADLVSLSGTDAARLSPQQAAALAILEAGLKPQEQEQEQAVSASPEASAAVSAANIGGRGVSAETGGSGRSGSPGGCADAADLAGLLCREMRHRIRRAQEALESFPEGPRLAVLRALPATLVGEGAGPSSGR
jgi:geranylgeranyl pyrophosphate synthase